MSDIYKEALADAKKLREIAEIDARNKVIEKVTPYISEMITNNIQKISTANLSEQYGHTSVFVEQEEDDLDLDLSGDAEAMPTTDPAGQDNLDASLQGAEPANAEGDAPIEPAGVDLGDVAVPDEDGKITVDFEDLFVKEPEAPEVAPEPVATEPTVGTGTEEEPAAPEAPGLEAPAVDAGGEQEDELGLPGTVPESYARNQKELSTMINEAYFKVEALTQTNKVLSDISVDSMKQRLFSLVENMDALKENGEISGKIARINENKLEYLYQKLKDAQERNSYRKISEKKEPMTTTLKDLAATLFESDEKVDLEKDSMNSGETGVHVDQEYTDHAKKQSGVSPKLGGKTSDLEASTQPPKLSEEMDPPTGTVDEDNINDVDHGETPWEDSGPRLNENSPDANPDANSDIVDGAAGFGDTNEDPAVEFVINEEELREAVRRIRQENIKRKMARLQEASDGSDAESWEDGEPEGGKDPSQDHLKEEMEMQLDEQEEFEVVEDDMPVDDVAMDDVAVEGGDDTELVLRLDLPDELEAMLADLDASAIDVDVDLEPEMEGGMDDMGADDMPVDDVMAGDDAGEEVLMDDEVVESGMAYESARKKRLARLAEARKRRIRRQLAENMKAKQAGKKPARAPKTVAEQKAAAKARVQKAAQTKKALQENKKLKASLAEQNLFTAKTVFLNKFLLREGLSKQALRTIVEHLDRAKTLAEAKVIYQKINQSLNKHEQASKKLAGSTSKVVKSGSATNLNESISHESDANKAARERWQKLAGIKK